jgi:hypothetical protein
MTLVAGADALFRQERLDALVEGLGRFDGARCRLLLDPSNIAARREDGGGHACRPA